MALHEMTRTKLFTFVSEDSKKKLGEKLSFQEFVETLLNTLIEARPISDDKTTFKFKRPYSELTYDLYKEFLDYEKKKKVLSFPARLSFSEKLKELDNIICDQVDSLIEVINNTGQADFSNKSHFTLYF